MTTYHVRLRPYDPTKGNVLRMINITALGGLVFEEGKVVEKISGQDIDERMATALRAVTQRPGEPDLFPNAPPAFDVLDPTAMRSLLASEARAKLGLTPDAMRVLADEFGVKPPEPQPAQAPRRRARAVAPVTGA
jgi:hypothetical protein